MDLFIGQLIGAVIQMILFSLIPLVWWLITARKKVSFFEWAGLIPVKGFKENKTFAWILGISAAFMALSVFMLFMLRGVETAASEFDGAGIGALPAIAVYACLKTALPEEIVFRGFLLKRIAAKFGFTAGNIVQSVMFGLLHGVMFFPLTGAVKTVLIILFTGGIGFCMGYVNEKKGSGSVFPSWCIHAAANIFSGLCSALMIFS